MGYVSNYYRTNEQTRMKILKRFSMFDGVGLDLSGASSYDEALAGQDLTIQQKRSSYSSKTVRKLKITSAPPRQTIRQSFSESSEISITQLVTVMLLQ